MGADSKIIKLIVLIIIVIIVAVLLYRSYYKTEEERHDNVNKLYLGIGVAIVAVIAVGYLMEGGDSQEYGVRDSVRSWWRTKREQREAGQDAKRAAEREVKQRQRADKQQDRDDQAAGRNNRTSK